jgi:hypothetical protein
LSTFRSTKCGAVDLDHVAGGAAFLLYSAAAHIFGFAPAAGEECGVVRGAHGDEIALQCVSR